MYNTKNLHTTHTCSYVGEKKCIYNDKTIMLITKHGNNRKMIRCCLRPTEKNKSPSTAYKYNVLLFYINEYV